MNTFVINTTLSPLRQSGMSQPSKGHCHVLRLRASRALNVEPVFQSSVNTACNLVIESVDK